MMLIWTTDNDDKNCDHIKYQDSRKFYVAINSEYIQSFETGKSETQHDIVGVILMYL